uniref:Receptor L-domain domain-containing protein n=2 Tax=Haemonchus contortus TaxID=6289 RepID=A0A7I4YFS8_HAECO
MQALCLVAYFSALLCTYAHAFFTDQECASYPALVTDADYVRFAEGCAGKEVLGFKFQQEFHAIRITEPLFNGLFANARRINFHIYVQNTEFRRLELPRVEYIPGLTIRNNALLEQFRILKRYQFDRTVFGPTVVTVDGNKMLDDESMGCLRYLCSYCDIFKWSKCSALEPVSPFNYGRLVEQCRGEKLIKARPYSHFILHLRYMTYEQFRALFAEATHIQLGFRMIRVPWTTIEFPKLVRLIPVFSGVRTIVARNNPYLRIISFPLYHSEGFGALNYMEYVEIVRNRRLKYEVISSLEPRCRFCYLQPYDACASLEVQQTTNVVEFAQMCSGKRVWKPQGTAVIEIDISSLEQEIIDELFRSVTYIKMCIILRQSQIQYLRMPNLIQLYSCEPGRPAFTIEGNMQLEVIEVSPMFEWQISYEPFTIIYNPALRQYPPLQQCKYCAFEHNTRCGVTWPALAYTTLEEILQNCMGKPRIVFTEVVTVTQEQFTELCSRALYLQMCFNITNTDYTSISCPMLRAVAPCQPGQQVWTIVGNSQLQSIVINTLVKFSVEEKIMIVRENPLIPNNELIILKEICKDCVIEYESMCRDITVLPSFEVFLQKCSGQKVISLPGIEVNYSFTEVQINQLFREAIEVVMCLNLRSTAIQNLLFPKLTRWQSCEKGKAAITVIDNPFLVNITFPSCQNNLCIESGIISGNPLLSPGFSQSIPVWCSNCELIPYVPACGLGDQSYTVQQLVTACAEKTIITPNEGSVIVIKSTVVTQAEMNAFCANVIYMQACIQITNSMYTSLRCPYLQKLVPCQPGRPAIEIINNPYLTIVEIPTTVVIPVNENVIIIDRNAQLSPVIVQQLQQVCPMCQIENDFSTCSELEAIGDVATFVEKCAGQPIITFKFGVEQQLVMTEEQITKLFVNAVEVQMCLVVRMSSIRQLVFPKLMQWTSCAPGKNALVVVNNPQLEVLSFPACSSQECIESIVVQGNPYLASEQINVLQSFCLTCHLEYFAPACGLGNQVFSVQQLVNACAGKQMIVPALNSPGIIIYSKDVTEYELNRFCSNAVYMQACLVIEKSTFSSLQCPYLERIVPCEPGRAVFEIIENVNLLTFSIPSTVVFPEGEKVVIVTGNPLLPQGTITKLKTICPFCDIKYDFSKCRMVETFGSVEELVERCAGQPVIIGEPGFTLQYNLTEKLLERLFSEAVEVKMCLVVKATLITNLVFPKLTKWTSCAQDKPALTIVNNPFLGRLQFPMCTNQECISGVVIEGNPLLSITELNQIKSWCINCNLQPYVPACGLGNGPFTVQQFVQACAGQQIIKQPQGFEVTIQSTEVTEEEMNSFCSQAIFIEACIVITNSQYQSLRCPYLQEVRPCKLGQPAITIVDNAQLQTLEFPELVKFEEVESMIVVKNNPLIPPSEIAFLRNLCPLCDIQHSNSQCKEMTVVGSVEELVEMCQGAPVITTVGGVVIREQFTEPQIVKLFSGAREVKMCAIVNNTSIENLSFPHVVRWTSCKSGLPALTVTDNMKLKNIQFPSCKQMGCIESGVISGNSLLPRNVKNVIKQYCSDCVFGQSQNLPVLSGGL